MHFVIVGSGVAGVNVARILARAGLPDIQIDLYTDEAYLYYPRPRLPDFLAGEVKLEELIQYPHEWYSSRGIAIHLGQPVTAIDPANKRLTLSGGGAVSYDRLLLANGSHPNIPPIQGVDKAGVFSLRSLADAMAICDYARQASRAVVIGGGLLGLEAARGLRALGMQVTVVEFFDRLLPRQLDATGAGILQGQMEAMGIQVILNAVSEEIFGAERVAGVRLKDRRSFPGELVLISAGVRSNTEWASAAGLAAQRGVIVDTAMRTSAPDIWAAGDVAEFEGRVWGIVPAAVEQARVAGANMLAEAGQTPATYVDIVPSNTLKVMGIDLTSIGVVNPDKEGYQELRHCTPEAGVYRKLVLQEGRIVGAILLGDKDRVAPINTLIGRGTDVSAHANDLLADEFDLKTLLA